MLRVYVRERVRRCGDWGVGGHARGALPRWASRVAHIPWVEREHACVGWICVLCTIGHRVRDFISRPATTEPHNTHKGSGWRVGPLSPPLTGGTRHMGSRKKKEKKRPGSERVGERSREERALCIQKIESRRRLERREEARQARGCTSGAHTRADTAGHASSLCVFFVAGGALARPGDFSVWICFCGGGKKKGNTRDFPPQSPSPASVTCAHANKTAMIIVAFIILDEDVIMPCVWCENPCS